MLVVDGIHTYYGHSYILQGVSLGVLAGQVVALLGRNGMGKTTTARSIVGLTPPRAGSVVVDGRDLTGLPAHAVARAGIGLVPQGRRVFGSLTVEQNLTVVAPEGGRDPMLMRVYELFPELRVLRDRRAVFLSGGEQQMLAIGRALVTHPRVLLMDEPTEGLAPVVVERVATAVAELSRQGAAVLLIEQNMAFALKVAEAVYVLEKGQVVYAGLSHEFARRTDLQQRYLGVAPGQARRADGNEPVKEADDAR